MKKEVALRIKAGLEGTPLAIAFQTNGVKTPIEFPRRWIPKTIDVADYDRCVEDVRHGRVYTINQIARTLHCSYRTARGIFQRELGVIRLGGEYRVPETVLQNVLHQIMNADVKENR